MADDFKDGDTVQLKSGGPMMTIGHLGKQTRSRKAQGAWCDWFDEKHKPQEEWYPLTSLKKVNP